MSVPIQCHFGSLSRREIRGGSISLFKRLTVVVLVVQAKNALVSFTDREIHKATIPPASTVGDACDFPQGHGTLNCLFPTKITRRQVFARQVLLFCIFIMRFPRVLIQPAPLTSICGVKHRNPGNKLGPARIAVAVSRLIFSAGRNIFQEFAASLGFHAHLDVPPIVEFERN